MLVQKPKDDFSNKNVSYETTTKLPIERLSWGPCSCQYKFIIYHGISSKSEIFSASKIWLSLGSGNWFVCCINKMLHKFANNIGTKEKALKPEESDLRN